MLRDQSGKHLWIATETGEFEPEESYNQIHSRKRVRLRRFSGKAETSSVVL